MSRYMMHMYIICVMIYIIHIFHIIKLLLTFSEQLQSVEHCVDVFFINHLA